MYSGMDFARPSSSPRLGLSVAMCPPLSTVAIRDAVRRSKQHYVWETADRFVLRSIVEAKKPPVLRGIRFLTMIRRMGLSGSSEAKASGEKSRKRDYGAQRCVLPRNPP